MTATPAPRDAVRAKPWRSGEPPYRPHVYPPAARPMLRIRIDGRWRTAVVHARHHRAKGVAYQVTYTGPDPWGRESTLSDCFYWDPAAMRTVRTEAPDWRRG